MKLRKALSLIGPLVLAVGLGGCLQPVNGIRFGNETINSQLAEVTVARSEGYLGHIVKAELDYLLTNGAPARNSRYQLKMKLVQGQGSSLVDSATGRPQIATLQVTTTYELFDAQLKKIRGSGTTMVSASYDRSSQRFATIRAQRDAEERVGKALAERMKIIVVSILAQGEGATAAPAPAITPFVDPVEEAPAREPGDDG